MKTSFSILIAFSFAGSAWTQTDPFFPKPDYFRKHFASTPPRVELQPPARLADYAVGGKLELSLKNFLDLTMANNPDIGIQRLNVDISRDAILRSFSIFDPVATASFSTARQQSPSGSLLADRKSVV